MRLTEYKKFKTVTKYVLCCVVGVAAAAVTIVAVVTLATEERSTLNSRSTGLRLSGIRMANTSTYAFYDACSCYLLLQNTTTTTITMVSAAATATIPLLVPQLPLLLLLLLLLYQCSPSERIFPLALITVVIP